MHPLLPRFIASFQKAINAEMEAMRQRLGPFEVSLAGGQILDADESEQGGLYVFKVLQPNDKLALQTECTLRHGLFETLATITGIDRDQVTLRCQRKISLNDDSHTLVIYPWFLYEKLIRAMESLLLSSNHFIPTALAAFGKIPPQRRSRPLLIDHSELNPSQQQAVQLCSDSNPAFVWGPPGTGKTFTLGHIVTELLGQGKRILITSTTNAAVDQALAKLADLKDAQESFKQGQIVRIGQTGAETFGAGLTEVVKRLNFETEERLKLLKRRRQIVERRLKECTLLLEKLDANIQPRQLDLFGRVQSAAITGRDLGSVFSANRVRRIVNLTADRQKAVIARRRQRLEGLPDLYQRKIIQSIKRLRDQETTVVKNARVILATMTNMYLSSLMAEERFDVVIIEEAGMAVLPTLFYCATLAGEKAIMVGDPKQLPPIVQSRDGYVHKAMGRNIFEVTVPDPHANDGVVMLDTQYRMHPLIGDLVSHLFYGGQLRHGENTIERERITRKKPYPGAPLVVMDSESRTTCATHEGGYSRFNEKSAQVCVELAVEAIRGGIESVAIITPYVAQSRLIRQRLASFPREAKCVESRTVHRFQGGERDLVILDTVDAAPLSPGVLLAGHAPDSSARNLINVSISRARGKLIIISDVDYFSTNSPHSVLNEMLRQAIKVGRRVAMG